jgi:2-hydroxy-6-oxonona-2,4-dienedioate hydrolase
VNQKIFRNIEGHRTLEEWYDRFLNLTNCDVEADQVPSVFGSIHVLLAGNRSNPPLVCLHAMMTSSAHLLSEIEKLTDHYFLIIPDLPGQSVKGIPHRFSYSDDSLSDWLECILDHYQLSEIDLLGVSLGGFVALRYSISFPGKVRNLVMVVPAGIVNGSMLTGAKKMMWPFLRYKLSPTEQNLRKFLEPILTTWNIEWAHYMGDAFRFFKPDFRVPPVASDAELKSIEAKTLVVAADSDISFPGAPLVKRVSANINGAETELLNNCSHCPPTTDQFREWLTGRVHHFLEAKKTLDNQPNTQKKVN